MTCDVALESLNDYLDDAVAPPFRVVLEHHFHGCSDCAQELALAREMNAGLAAMRVPQSVPADFRARVLARAAAEAPARSWLHRYIIPAQPTRNPLLRAGIAVAALTLLFSRTPFYGKLMGPPDFVELPHQRVASAYPSDGRPELLFDGTPDATGSRGELNLILQPSADLGKSKLTLERMTDGLACDTAGIVTDQGKVLWQGALAADAPVTIPLHFRVTQPRPQRALFLLETDHKTYRRLLILPSDRPQQSPETPLRGAWTSTEALERIADRFGVVVSTDLTHQRSRVTDLSVKAPGRAIQSLATERGLQWKTSHRIYNVYDATPPRNLTDRK